ncbi:MAG: hypothetical protein ACYCSF_11855, partial [Acidimicrobiales bacterium]
QETGIAAGEVEGTPAETGPTCPAFLELPTVWPEPPLLQDSPRRGRALLGSQPGQTPFMHHGPVRHHRRRLGTTASLAMAAGVLLGACSSSPASGGRALGATPSTDHGAVATPGAARSVVAPTMAINNRSNAKLDSGLLATYEAGSAYALDNSTYRADRLAKANLSNAPFTIHLRSIGLVRQATWPAQFLAVGPIVSLAKKVPKAPSCAALLDFEKMSASGRWRIVLEPSTDNKDLPHFAVTAGGFAQRPTPAAVRAADAVPSEVAKALFSQETSGALGPFEKSDFTGSCWQLPDPRLDVIGAQQSGYTQRDLFSRAFPPDTAAFALAGGRTLVMFTLHYDDELIAEAPSRPIEWSRASVTKDPGAIWTYFLRPGPYSEIREKGAVEVAVELSSNHKHYTVIGSYSGVTSVTGTRASRASTQVPTGTLTSAH